MSPTLMGDLALRWIVTTLFGLSVARYVYILATHHGRPTTTINHLLHLTMSAAMILMVWRVGMNLPTVGPMIFFLLTGVWFVRAAGRVSCTTRDRLTNCYYAVMIAAMAWMYPLMNASLPGHSGHSHEHALSGSLAMKMPGMEMSTPDMPRTAWIPVVNWIATLAFAAVAVYWACRYFAELRAKPVPHAAQLARLELPCQAFTAAGTALMFGAMV